MRTTNEIFNIMRTEDTYFFKSLGERIASKRSAMGLKQNELAEQLGVTQQVIASYEVGRRRVPASLLAELAQILGVSIEELIGLNQSRRKPGPTPKLLQQIEQLQRLPKSKQKFVSEFIETVLQQA